MFSGLLNLWCISWGWGPGPPEGAISFMQVSLMKSLLYFTNTVCWVALSNIVFPLCMEQWVSSPLHYYSWPICLHVVSRYFSLSLCLTSSCQFRPLICCFPTLLHSWLAKCCQSVASLDLLFVGKNKFKIYSVSSSSHFLTRYLPQI